MIFMIDFFSKIKGFLNDVSPEMTGEELRAREYYSEGKDFFENKEYDKALECFHQFVLYEQNPRALMLMAELYFIKKDFDNAILYYEKTLRNSDAPHHYWGSYDGISRCYIEKNELDKAREYCQKVLKANSSIPIAQNTMGTICKLTGNLPLAVEHYNEAIKDVELNASSYLDPWFNLLELYFELQDIKNALNITKKISFMVAGGFIEENKEIEYWENEHIERITGYIIKAIDIDKNDSGLYLNLGKIYYGRKEFSKAVEILSRAASINPGNEQIQAILGFSYARVNKFDLAIEHINKAILIDPDEKRFYNLQGRTYFLQHEYDKAFSSFEKSLKRSAGSVNDPFDVYDGFACRAIGFCYYKKGQYKEAIEYYSIAFERSEPAEDNKVEAYNALIRLYYQLKDYDNTMKMLNMAKSMQAGAYYKRYFEKIYSRDDNDVITLFFLSIYYLKDLAFEVDLSLKYKNERNLSPRRVKELLELKEKITVYLNKVKQKAPDLASKADEFLSRLELVWPRNNFKEDGL